jgi:hypothetical protein
LKVVESAFELLEPIGDFVGGGEDFFPGGGEVELFAQLFDEGHPNQLGQLFHLLGDGGLRQVEFFGGAGEATVTGDRFEDLELVEGGLFHGRSGFCIG